MEITDGCILYKIINMKLIQSAAIGVCLFASISVQAQQTSNDTTTKLTSPAEKNKEVLKSESKKKEYKSKEWQQGNEVINDTANRAGEKPKLRMRHKPGRQPGTPPPPPPPPPPKD
jgi:cell division protein FtsL